MDLFLKIIPWIAVVFLPLGYWKQVWHIHKHKEVRDLNLGSYILFAIAYMVLGIESVMVDSCIFLMKNILVAIPTLIITFQIIVHREDKWED